MEHKGKKIGLNSKNKELHESLEKHKVDMMVAKKDLISMGTKCLKAQLTLDYV